MREKTLILTVLTLILIALFSTQIQAISSCDKITPQGVIADTDCDLIPNFKDNCVMNHNPDQRDSDRNGIGDACDSQILEINVYPGAEIHASETINLEALITNNKPEAIRAKITVFNENLNLNQESLIELAPYSYKRVKFNILIPRCSYGKESLRITFDKGYEVYNKFQQIEILNTDDIRNCRPGNTLDNSAIDMFESLEMKAKESKIMPITITNFNNQAQTYELSLTNIQNLGSYRIDPSNILNIPAGVTKTAYVYIKTEDYATIGRNEAKLIIKNGEFQEEIPFTIRIINELSKSKSDIIKKAIEIAFILIVLAFIISAGIIAYKKMTSDDEDEYEEVEETKRNKNDNNSKEKTTNQKLNDIEVEDFEDEDDFQSYY